MKTINLSITQLIDREIESREAQAHRLRAQEAILRGQLGSSMNEQQLAALVRSLQAAEEFPPKDGDELMQEAVNDRGRAYIGLYWQANDDGYSIIDFEKLVQKTERINVVKSAPDDEYPGVEVVTTRGTEELTGPAAKAFLRYLVFMGLFAAIEYRVPCPCAVNPLPQACGLCGGLGWIIGDPKLDYRQILQQ